MEEKFLLGLLFRLGGTGEERVGSGGKIDLCGDLFFGVFNEGGNITAMSGARDRLAAASAFMENGKAAGG